METVKYDIKFESNSTAVFGTITKGAEDATKSVDNLTKSSVKAWETLLTFNQAAQAIEGVGRALDGLNAPGISLNSNMADLQAITGLAGEGLQKIEQAARQASMTFGTSATANVESYKLLLSQLSPELGKNSVALKAMGDNVNILSKTMGGNTVAATNVLTTALNQYGISMDDPIAASKVMAEYMNIMAAAAREGSAELPQIQQALSQAGMMAKTVGVSFSETNAAIQVLDKAGKKGAEGGVALRNVMSSLAKGRFLPKDVREELAAAGVNINKLTNQALPLADRLRAIGPIFNDTALMSKLFGRENVASAIALAGNIDELQQLNSVIQGTNTAVDQAAVIMDSYAERINRQKAWFDNLKTSIFQATQPVMPFVTAVTAAAGGVAQAGFAINGFNAVSQLFVGLKVRSTIATIFESAAIQNNTIATTGNTTAKGLGALASKAYGVGMGIVTITTTIATTAVKALSKAIYSIPLIGWVLAIIAAIIMLVDWLTKLFKYLWDNSRTFRGILYGIWAAIKAVIYNIGLIFQRLWTGVIKPVFMFIVNIAVSVWKFIVNAFYKVRDTIVSVFKTVWIAIVGAWESVKEFFTNMWNWISGIFSAIGGFLYQWLIKPFVAAFSKIWDFVVGIFNKIKQKIIQLFQPIIDLIKWIFGIGDGETKNVIEEAKKGYQQGAAEVDEKKKQKEEQPDDNTDPVLPKGAAPVPTFNDTTGTIPIGDGTKSSKSITLNINKLVETIQISVTNLKEGKEQLRQAVAEVLLTAANDINLAQ